ncbi:MAG TPA: zinc-dependent metalloprotease [Chryseolinea sp.]
MRAIGIIVFVFAICFTPFAQTPIRPAVTLAPQDTSKKETPSSVPAGNTQLSAPRNYNNIIRSNAITRKGLFTVHKVDDNYYFEVPDSLLGRDILVVCRIAQGAAGIRPEYTGYAGDQIGNTVIRFEKGPGSKLFLRRITFEENAGDSTDAMYSAVVRSNLQPLVSAFGIGAYSPNGRGSVIEITDYVNGDNDILFFSSASKKTMRVGGLVSNTSYIKDISSFPLNVEIRTIKTYRNTVTDNTFTMELNTSLVLLPKKPMRKRFADRRIGYFTERYTDYDANPQGVKVVSYIKRWRLEPKPGDMEKYMRGELVEPQKPILYYIDPATPKNWVPYLIQGVMDWQAAFEKAGFKNAILAKAAPTDQENPNWSLEDSRHSAIVYKPSSFANAAGPIITDPRSGEILESHINWYHNLMSILREWYMIQCGPLDRRAQKMQFDDKLMGQLIRSVASHEVGHSLGLTHNYAASSSVPVEKLRDRVWLEANGHTPSIMDYARFNYVAQPQDSVGERGLISRIGIYDHWAIEWGYRIFPEARTAEAEIPAMNDWVVEKLQNEKLRFGSEFTSDDPRTQTEDIGDNAMKAGEYGIRNLQRVVPNLIKWTHQEHENYRSLAQMYNATINQFDYYLGHALAYVGGMYETIKSSDQPGPVYDVVPVELQWESMDFLTRHIFTTPTWLLDTAILTRIGKSPTQIISRSQNMILSSLLGNNNLAKMSDAQIVYGKKAYPLINFIDDLDNAMWNELKTYDTISTYRRNLQQIYVDKLIDLVSPARSDKVLRDIPPIIINKLGEIQARIKRALPRTKGAMTIYHLKFIENKINNALKAYSG